MSYLRKCRRKPQDDAAAAAIDLWAADLALCGGVRGCHRWASAAIDSMLNFLLVMCLSRQIWLWIIENTAYRGDRDNNHRGEDVNMGMECMAAAVVMVTTTKLCQVR